MKWRPDGEMFPFSMEGSKSRQDVNVWSVGSGVGWAVPLNFDMVWLCALCRRKMTRLRSDRCCS
jgi:hypothetical protein